MARTPAKAALKLGRRCCGNCDHWDRIDHPTDSARPLNADTTGWCKAHPPTVFDIDLDTGDVIQAHPIKDAEDRCGEFTPIVH